MNAIFVDPATALHVSMLVQALPVSAPTSLRQALIRMLECMPVHTYQQAAMLTRLIGTRSMTVNFAGLTTLEIHGQCALVTSSAERRLLPLEWCVMLARFAPTQRMKAAGINGLAVWLAPVSPIADHRALSALIWRRYVPRSYRDRYSLRAIALRTGLSKSVLGRASQWLDGESDGLEYRALVRLEEAFTAHGVCAPALA